MAATGSSAIPQSFSGGWLTVAQQNAVAGTVATPEWPGPTSEDHAAAGPPNPGRSGPPDGQAPANPIQGSPVYPDLSGGQITDQVADLGHSAEIAAFDSNAGPAFAPPGAIADTHGYDTGGIERHEHVPLPKSPGWWRRTLTGQTWNRQAQVTDNAGWDVNAPNDRQDLDQYQGQNANGYDPFTIPYSERPLRANLAAEAFPIQDQGGVYYPDGALPDMESLGGQGNLAYQAPPDPTTNVQPAAV